MTIYFDQNDHGSAVVRSVVVDRTNGGSDVVGSGDLDYDNGRLGGVAPEAHVAREKALDARVQAAHQAGQAYELGDQLWIPVPKTIGLKL